MLGNATTHMSLSSSRGGICHYDLIRGTSPPPPSTLISVYFYIRNGKLSDIQLPARVNRAKPSTSLSALILILMPLKSIC